MHVSREDVGALAVAVMTLTDRMRRALAASVDRTEVGVLRVVADRRGARPTEVADELGVHPSSVTRHAQVLQRAGKLTAEPDPADGRASVLAVTPAGLADLGRVYEAGVDAFHEVLAGWTVEEVRAVTAGLTRLVAALDARAAGATGEQRSGPADSPMPPESQMSPDLRSPTRPERWSEP